MGVLLSDVIKPTYVRPCTAFVDNDDPENPGVIEVPFTARFMRRSMDQQDAMQEKIKDAQDFVMELVERFGSIDRHRHAIKTEDPKAYARLIEIEKTDNMIIVDSAYEDWCGIFGIEGEPGVDLSWSQETKDLVWNAGHKEFRSALIRAWLSSRNGARAREGNSEPLPAT